MFKLIHPPLKLDLKVSSPFGLRTLDGAWWHQGIDYPCPIGTPIYSVADGVVKNTKDGGSYGLYVDIWHGGAGSLYAHLSNFVVKPGDFVKAGDLLGYSGATGSVIGPHLHFEIRLCRTYTEFWERCVRDITVFMRCVDPQMFVDDYMTRISVGIKQANTIVQHYAALDDNTMVYLNFYKYDTALITKLAKAII